MIYQSNLTAPDLAPYFPSLLVKPRPWSMGHDVPSDAEVEPDCGFLLHDEAAILHACAKRAGGSWVDIGSRFGWSSHAINCHEVGFIVSIDPLYKSDDYKLLSRVSLPGVRSSVNAGTSDEFFAVCGEWTFDGFMIDGNHDSPFPLNDAKNAAAHLKETGVIIFHDFWGRPIREGVEYLMDNGFSCRIYNTPNGMAVCWRGNFQPPDHVADPTIDWKRVRRGRAPEFNFARCV